MSKHTPGPWHLDFDEAIESTYVSISAAKHKSLAEVVWRFATEEQSPNLEANAHLIAAAPELLEALERLVANLNEGDFISNTRIDEARAALAKAKGE
jgi:hypothetical protein